MYYILTQFNVGIYSHPDEGNSKFVPPDCWMDHRMDVFKRFTLPSVHSQTNKDFGWILLVDEKTPERYMRELRNTHTLWIMTGAKVFDQDQQAKEVSEHLRKLKTGPTIITTRLDSDDAIREDFIDLVKYSPMTIQAPHLIRFTKGYLFVDIYKAALAMEYRFHVPSLIERSDDFKTVLAWDNSKIPYIGLTELNQPGWLQVIHGHNIINNIHSDHNRKVSSEAIVLKHLDGFKVRL